jgi:hypothetical protein
MYGALLVSCDLHCHAQLCGVRGASECSSSVTTVHAVHMQLKDVLYEHVLDASGLTSHRVLSGCSLSVSRKAWPETILGW